MPKQRLDQRLADQEGLPLEIAKSHIMMGHVLVGNDKQTKPGYPVTSDAQVQLIRKDAPYVSRAAQKLKGAHEAFEFAIEGRVVLDIGISTGGFTDYCLQQGASLVLGVDVGYGQVAEKLRQDSRLVILERTNARQLTQPLIQAAIEKQSPDKVDQSDNIALVVMDVSFISIRKIMPVLKPIVQPNADFICLIKPQFESKNLEGLSKNQGVVSDENERQSIVRQVIADLSELGFTCLKTADSTLKGPKGNKEVVAWLKMA